MRWPVSGWCNATVAPAKGRLDNGITCRSAPRSSRASVGTVWLGPLHFAKPGNKSTKRVFAGYWLGRAEGSDEQFPALESGMIQKFRMESLPWEKKAGWGTRDLNMPEDERGGGRAEIRPAIGPLASHRTPGSNA
eukprot:2564624-Amphidinium_carterae.1